MGSKRVRKAVVPAAGRGTRLRPVTHTVPKELLPVVNIPLIDLIIEEAASSGIEQVVLVTSEEKPLLTKHFENVKPKLEVIPVIQDKPKGLGHAVQCAREAVGDEPFAVLLPDDVYTGEPPTRELVRAYESDGTPTLALLEVPEDEVSRYGVAKPSWQRGRLVGIADLVEKPKREEAPSRFVLPGRYVLEPDIFETLSNTLPGAGGEIQLTDGLRVLAKQQRLIGVLVSGERHDGGEPLGLVLTSVAYGLRDPEIGTALRAALQKLLEP